MTGMPQSIAQAARQIRAGELTSRALVELVQGRADALDPRLQIFIDQYRDESLAAADRADRELASGIDRGPLHGIPMGLKDNLSTNERNDHAGSDAIDPAWSRRGDGTAVRRLREAGAVIVGKAATSEFAVGLADDFRRFPVPRNPWDRERFGGGSSGGSGSGLAAEAFLGSLGTDTGGSIRDPASMNNVCSLRPTFGVVPKDGCYPAGYTYDAVGPMAKTASDCGLILSAMAGADPADPTSRDYDLKLRTDDSVPDLRGVRIGVARSAFEGSALLDADVRKGMLEAEQVFRELGAEIVDVSLPHWEALDSASINGSMSEVFSHHLPNLQRRWSDYSQQTRTVIANGAFIAAADYLQAQRVRRIGLDAMRESFRGLRAVLMPATWHPAPLWGKTWQDESATTGTGGISTGDYASPTSLTSPWAALGLPVLTVPIGFNRTGLPFGMQIVSGPFADESALAVGRAFQSVTTWHTRRPNMVQELEQIA